VSWGARAPAGQETRAQKEMALLAQRRAKQPQRWLANSLARSLPGLPPSKVTFELGQGVQLHLAALAAELRRALGALLPLRLAHRFPGEAVHFLRGRDGGAGSPRRRRRRRRRRRHLRGVGAWQLRLLLAPHGRRQRQEGEAGERRGELAPLRPRPHRPPAPGTAELLLAARQRFTATCPRRRCLVGPGRAANSRGGRGKGGGGGG
jgi:hypothetical protein